MSYSVVRFGARQAAFLLVLGLVASGCSEPGDVSGDAPQVDTLWSTELDEPVSDAVVAGSIAVVDTGENDIRQGMVVDLGSGKKLWDLPAGDWTGEAWVADDSVILSNENLVAVFDIKDGKERFSFEAADGLTDFGAVATNEYLIIAEIWPRDNNMNVHRFTGMSLATGETEWTEDVELDFRAEIDAPMASPQVDDSKGRSEHRWIRRATDASVVYYGNPSHGVTPTAISARSGKASFEDKDVPFDPLETQIFSAGSDWMVHIPKDSSECEHTLYRVNGDSGDSDPITTRTAHFSNENRKWQCGIDAHSPLVMGNVVFAQDESNRPQVIDIESGETTFSANDSGEPLYFGQGVATYLEEGKSKQGKVVAADVSTGKELWQSESNDSGDGGKLPSASGRWTVAGDLLVLADFGSEKSLSRGYNLRSGELKWIYPDAEPLATNENVILFQEHRDGGIELTAVEIGSLFFS